MLSVPVDARSSPATSRSPAPHERVGGVLARLDAWLTERVDIQQRATHDRLQFIEIKELAQDGGIDGRHRDREIRALRLGKRPRGRDLLPLQELTQLGALEVIQFRESRAARSRSSPWRGSPRRQ